MTSEQRSQGCCSIKWQEKFPNAVLNVFHDSSVLTTKALKGKKILKLHTIVQLWIDFTRGLFILFLSSCAIFRFLRKTLLLVSDLFMIIQKKVLNYRSRISRCVTTSKISNKFDNFFHMHACLIIAKKKIPLINDMKQNSWKKFFPTCHSMYSDE